MLSRQKLLWSRGLLLNHQCRSISKTPSMPYTKEQQCQVLDLLNTASERDLRYLLGQSFVMRILHAREEQGTFDDLQSVFSIKGMKNKGLLKFCENVLYGTNKEDGPKFDMSSSIIPLISDERLETIKNVCALNIIPPHVTCVKMDRERNVLEWQQIHATVAKIKHDMTSYYDIAAQIYPQIPPADIYVLQFDSAKLQKLTGMTARANTAITSMLVTMLSFGEPDQPKVVSIKARTLGQVFRLYVGEERVSSQQTFDALLQKGELCVSSANMAKLGRGSVVEQEFMRITALQSLAFLRVCKM